MDTGPMMNQETGGSWGQTEGKRDKAMQSIRPPGQNQHIKYSAMHAQGHDQPANGRSPS